jgi:uncharacterized protein (DUF433 family)
LRFDPRNPDPLPDCLESVDGGIRVAGHRVPLLAIVREVMDGTSRDRIGEMFPTVPGRKLDDVIGFIEGNSGAMREYDARWRAEFDARFGDRIGMAPSTAELRARVAKAERGVDRCASMGEGREPGR